ncbi:MAG: tyrosine-type recombinase/integrase [Planctomycetota bacterium]
MFTQPNRSSWQDPKRLNLQIRKVLEEIPDEKIPAWKKWGNDTFTRFTAHGLRHTATSIMLSLGVQAHVIDAQLGWTSRAQTTMRHHYATVPERELIDLARVMADTVTGTRSASRSASNRPEASSAVAG